MICKDFLELRQTRCAYGELLRIYCQIFWSKESYASITIVVSSWVNKLLIESKCSRKRSPKYSPSSVKCINIAGIFSNNQEIFFYKLQTCR